MHVRATPQQPGWQEHELVLGRSRTGARLSATRTGLRGLREDFELGECPHRRGVDGDAHSPTQSSKLG